jgi:hypothetical protein
MQLPTILLVITAVAGTEGAFTVLDGPHAGLVAETAQYQLYGPINGAVTGTAVFLDGEDLCHPDTALVRGKIVISTADKCVCGMIEVYRRLVAAGATAFVKDSFLKQPGLMTYTKDTWGLPESPRSSTLMVEVSSQDVALEDLDQALVRIAPPHNDEYATLFESLYWTICHRVLTPLWAVYVFILALAEGRRLWVLVRDAEASGLSARNSSRVETRQVGVWVCFIEGGCALLLGATSACGQFGPYVMPAWYHNWFWTALTGMSLFPSIMLIFLLWEQLRTSGARRPYWAAYRMRWLAGLAGCCGLDLIMGVVRNAHLDQTNGGRVVYSLIIFIFMVAYGAVGTVFVRAAEVVSRPLRTFLAERLEPQFAERRKATSRIVLVLVMNGVSAFGMTFAALLWTVESLLGVPNVTRYSILVLFLFNIRLMAAYWHVEAVRPKADTSSIMFLAGEVLRALRRCRPTWAVAPAPLEEGDFGTTLSPNSSGALFEIELEGHIGSRDSSISALSFSVGSLGVSDASEIGRLG